MKALVIVWVFIVSLPFAAKTQKDTAQLLKKPANWSFERFVLPPSFAPRFPFKGAEELRFSPGMFNKDSTNYFTYAFVAQLDNMPSVAQNDIRDYLMKYFKGLCGSVAKDRKLAIDTNKISVSAERKNGTQKNEIIYNVSLNIFGVFADGAPVKLNMEVKVLVDGSAQKTYLIFVASPREKSDEVWKELFAIQKGFTIPI